MKKIILIFLLLAINAFAANKKILIIASYHKEYQWQIDYINGIKNTLGSKYDYFEFVLNTKRLPEKEYKILAVKAFEYYKKLKPDLVVIGDDSALGLLKDNFIKEKVPVVFLGINNNIRNYFKVRPSNFTGVLERPPYQRNITFVKECMPKAANVLLVFDDSNVSKYTIKEEFGDKFSTRILGVKLTVRIIDSYDSWQKMVLEESENFNAVVLGLYSTLKDKTGKVVKEDEVLAWTNKNIRKPLFGTWSFSVGKGKTIGGLVLSGKEQGIEAGKIIQKILEEGVKPISIYPVTAQQGEYIVSKYELNRWELGVPKKYLSITKILE